MGRIVWLFLKGRWLLKERIFKVKSKHINVGELLSIIQEVICITPDGIFRILYNGTATKYYIPNLAEYVDEVLEVQNKKMNKLKKEHFKDDDFYATCPIKAWGSSAALGSTNISYL